MYTVIHSKSVDFPYLKAESAAFSGLISAHNAHRKYSLVYALSHFWYCSGETFSLGSSAFSRPPRYRLGLLPPSVTGVPATNAIGTRRSVGTAEIEVLQKINLYTARRPLSRAVLFSFGSSGYQWGCTVDAVSAKRRWNMSKMLYKISRLSGWPTV